VHYNPGSECHFTASGGAVFWHVMIPDRSYTEILARLHEFDSYLATLQVTRHKLRRIIANIEEINTACLKGRDAALALQQQATEEHFRELIWSLTEGNEWAESFPGIRNHDEATIRRLLRKALDAPLDPKLETDATFEARNTRFELLLGARFHLAGASAMLGGPADVSIDHAGFRLHVECKRPQEEQNISRRTAEGCTQLLNRFEVETHPNPVGMVAVSTSKALSGGMKMLFVERDRDLAPSLTIEAERIWESYCKPIIGRADRRVVGLICHVFTPAFIRTQGRLIAASQFDIFPRNIDEVLPLSGDDLRILLRCL
jgi:hypothetical protein